MRRFALAAAGFLVALCAAELVVRLATHVDEDGQRFLGAHRLLPFRMPLSRLREHAKALGDPAALFVYDSDLGWAPRPGATRRDGRVSIEQTGDRRAGAHFDRKPALRIVTVGDSFTFGDEVDDDETWPSQLEAELRDRGVDADVVNLGVNAYGLDQAVLRFERDGLAFEPDVVLLGLQPENLLRSLNVVRAAYYPGTSMPLSKPRFVLEDGGLRLVNRPTPPVEDVLEALADPAEHPLFRYEDWLDGRYRPGPLNVSVLYSLAQSVVAIESRATGYELTDEMAEIGSLAVDRLASAVEASGAELWIVHVPRRDDLETIQAGEEPWHGAWLAELDRRFNLVRPDLETPDVAAERFQPAGHYSPLQNALVARVVADHLEANR